MDAAANGAKALELSNYKEAIEHFTAALKEFPGAPTYLIKRSTAYLRDNQDEASLADAEQAVIAAQKRGKRELIVDSQFRRGCALLKLGKVADAAFVLNVVKKMDPKHKACDMYIAKAAKALDTLPDDDLKRRVTAKEIPELTEIPKSTSSATATGDATASTTSKALAVQPAQTTADKIRYEWYQNGDSVYFTLLAKGVPKDKAQIDIAPGSLSVNFPLQNGSSYDLTIEPLFAKVIPEKSTPRVTPHKVEIVLVKAQPGQKWATLELTDPAPKAADIEVLPNASNPSDPSASQTTTFAHPRSSAPSYPTSSKSGPKDWDKITNGDDEAEEVEGDAANHFFKKLFKGASPDVQRAMMKSYTESNGTALSTNWEEVSKGPVETSPPDGMEAKKWS